MLLSAVVFQAWAADIVVAGVFGNKAVLVIDGGAPRTMAAGDSVAGVTVIAVDRDAVTIESAGRRDRLVVGQQAVSVASREGGRSLTLVSDSRGHFSATGSINGVSVRFLVDTGATSVVMGPSLAMRAGIDFRSGQPGMAQTANGVTPMWRVRIPRLTVGDLPFFDIEAVVTAQDMPQVLLGMTFLNRMEMLRQGDTMVLRQRY